MKNAILLFVSLFISTIAIKSQSAANLHLPEELQISFYNASLAEARFNKSYIPDDRLYYESNIDTERKAIEETLQKYVDGSTGGKPNLLKEAFHPELNLYYVKNNQVATWSGNAYIADTKEGKPTGENGKILSIDYTNNAAMAKVEISHPQSTESYIDYFMLLKAQDKWTIVHKMFTKKNTLKHNFSSNH